MIKLPARLNMLVLSIALTAFSLPTVIGQISQGGLPYSLKSSAKKSTYQTPTYQVKAMNINALLAEDELNPLPYRYSTFEDLSINIKELGVEIDLPGEEGSMWKYRIESPDANSMQIYFDQYRIPEGAKLFIYNDDYSQILGAYTDLNNGATQSLMISDFYGSELIIEYFEPNNKAFEGKVNIGSIGKAYRNIKEYSSNEDENGFINVNCPEGADWQNEKHAVSRFTFRVGTSGFTCSGALMNNTNNDGTPYFLTANHCLETGTVAETVIAYFNSEFIGCDGPLKEELTLSGATLLATAAESDYTLLLFNDIPPANYQPYYAGWDATIEPASSAVGIHHPGGNPKKISVSDSAVVSHPFSISWEGGSNTPADSHWRVEFDRGQTAGGSSGSPMFNQDGKVIGQLHGGGEYVDFYGRLDYSWTTESDTDTTLKFYLDANDEGILLLDAYYPAENLPDPLLHPEFISVCDSAGIMLKGYSAFEPLTWEWEFSPTDITFLEGTDAQSENPIVEFYTKGEYSVTLTVTNSAGSESRTYNDALTVGSIINIDLEPLALVDNCSSNFDSLIIRAGGAKQYDWELSAESANSFFIVNDTVNPAVIKVQNQLDSTTTLEVMVTGSHGSCISDTNYSLTLLKQQNDMISNAIEIFEGLNGVFSNECASIEEGEPIPPFESCTGQLSWCDEYGTGEDIVENSVWFYYIPEDSGRFARSSEGMDNQIALYEAESVEDILSGNYNLLGANDDFTDKDFNPFISEVELVEGEKYWIQADGSAGGAIGDFFIKIEMYDPVNSNSSLFDSGESIKVYPIPANEMVTIEWNSFSNETESSIEIYNSAGVKMYQKSLYSLKNNKLEVDISEWTKGVYFISLQENGNFKTVKLIK